MHGGRKCGIQIHLSDRAGQLLATFIAIGLVDKAGRKPLLMIGNAVQVAALVTVGFIYARVPATHRCCSASSSSLPPAFADGHGAVAPGSYARRSSRPSSADAHMSVSTFCIWTGCLIVAQSFSVSGETDRSLYDVLALRGLLPLSLSVIVLLLHPKPKDEAWRRSRSPGIGAGCEEPHFTGRG